ncbi:BadF/BadG/BcrA/BcrD ATPase family protein [Loktanella sp. DJP18]|uniref:BadF/BadG/BcrA/BcrD ATPase family protein n=1 Tax=Loktanella sp. DJP18 TaxID=3409788 RepID=UPI003BB7608E
MTQTETLYIGVDGGGTGCRVALWDAAGRVLARAEGGPSNVTSDFEGASANILAALTQIETAVPGGTRAAVGHLGLAGAISDDVCAAIAARMPMGRCTVTGDMPTTVAGALGPQDGVVLAIGTGSFVGLKRGGVVTSVGGWGLQVSDNGSAAWIGRAGLAATLEAVDGLVPVGPMARQLLGRFDDDPNAIVRFAATARPIDYGTLAPVVLDSDDPAARAIVGQGADWLERALVALGHDDSLPLCLIGGLGPRYRDLLAGDRRRFVAPAGTALDGAFLLARGAA